jgi:ribosomal-protein-alanine N-acetyltransferase
VSAVLKPSWSLRPMRPGDLDHVVAVEQGIYSHPWTFGNFRDSLHAGYSCWVMERQGELIGYGVLMIGVGEAHLLNLSVAGAWQRRGFGRLLLQHFVEQAQRCGAARMLLEVRLSNIAARALYRQCGFLELSVRRGYYPAESGREDAILMGMDVPGTREPGPCA